MRAVGPLAFGVLAAVSSSLLLSLPASAAERDIESGSVTVTVQIDPLECTADCVVPPGTQLPATGLAPIEPLLWIAMALVIAGALFALRARTARHSRLLARAAPANAYAVLSDQRAPEGERPAAPQPSTRRRIERGDRA